MKHLILALLLLLSLATSAQQPQLPITAPVTSEHPDLITPAVILTATTFLGGLFAVSTSRSLNDLSQPVIFTGLIGAGACIPLDLHGRKKERQRAALSAR